MKAKEVRRDKLTGCIASEEFVTLFDEILERAEQTRYEVSLVMLDIDNFMAVNNEYGHEMGDQVLISLARHLEASINDRMLVFRYSGDQFAIVMDNTEKEEAFLLMEKIRAGCTFSDLKANRKDGVTPTISAGVSAYPSDGERIADIMRKADGALYKAKISGRNKICLSREEKMVTKTTHYTSEQLQRLSALAKKEQLGEAILLREALDDLLKKYDR